MPTPSSIKGFSEVANIESFQDFGCHIEILTDRNLTFHLGGEYELSSGVMVRLTGAGGRPDGRQGARLQVAVIR